MRKLLPGLIVAFFVSVACSVDAAIIYGPANHVLSGASLLDVTTLSSASLNGLDELFITYSVERTDSDSGDSWLTLTLNTTDGNFFEFVNTGVLGALTRTKTELGFGTHGAFQVSGGTWSPNNNAVDIDAASPTEHAVRITIGGLSSGGFTGMHSIVYEIDHYSSTFVSADRTFSGGTIDFGASDVGLNIDIRSHVQAHNVNNLTVFQLPIPEPSTFLVTTLGLLGMGWLGWRRCNRT